MKSLLAIILLAVACAAQAKNPGQSAQNCVTSHDDGRGKLTFTNRCNEHVFVMWCGDLTHSKKGCGDAPRGGYYTHTDNIPAGQARSTSIKGRYSWAACKGSIGFSNDGAWEDFRDGRYRCLPR